MTPTGAFKEGALHPMTNFSTSAAPVLPSVLTDLVARYEARFADVAPATAPHFSFEDADARSLVVRFAADWGDAQAAEGWHAGVIVDADELDAQGAIEARAVLARGDATTDDASAFEKAFIGAWADAYTARIVFAEARGW